MKILVLGDIIGISGRRAAKEAIKQLKKEHTIDLIIANGENLAHGSGMTKKTFDEMREAGIDFFTSGNHIYKKDNIFPEMEKATASIIRPANFPPGNIGKGWRTLTVKKKKILIINLIGRVFSDKDYDCPFRKIDEILDNIKREKPDIILVDFHAEATSEKIAMKYYLDGRATALWGTHTHIATADAEITEKGTAYITDIGMVGSKDSVIGIKKENIIENFLKQTGFKTEIPEGHCILNGIFLEIDDKGKAKTIKLIKMET